MAKSDSENEKMCDGCTKCCEHVAIEIDAPNDARDFQDIIWYVLHENVCVFVEDDGTWNIQFEGRCSALTKDGGCAIYKKRPYICRDYDQDECVKYGDGNWYRHLFENRDDVLAYLKKKNPAIWRKVK